MSLHCPASTHAPCCQGTLPPHYLRLTTPRFIALESSLITETSSLNGDILSVGRRTLWRHQLKMSLPGRGNIAACGCSDRDWSIL
jgi:hypothetical protein